MKDKIKLEVTTSQANLIIDALDVYLKQYGLKKCSFDAYCQGQKFRRDLHNILTEKGYEESQAELHKEADKEIWEQNNDNSPKGGTTPHNNNRG